MATTAFVVSVSIPAYNSGYFFALMTGTGLAGGLFISRTFIPRRAEDEIEQNEIKAQAILDRIGALPSGTPGDVRRDLWNSYKAVTSDLVRIGKG